LIQGEFQKARALSRDDYLSLRRPYEPENIRLVIVAESPPKTGKYFYNPAGVVSEPLFAAMMRQLECRPTTKDEGLREFQRRGWVLVDATYQPVDWLSEKERAAVILRYYPLLRADLTAILPDKSIPIILVKKNVCQILEPKLKEDGFNVLNKGSLVYFPSHSRQPDFHRQFGKILRLLHQN